MSLNASEVRWVATLARLTVDDDQLAEVTQQLSNIVDYVAQLAEVDTDGVEPLAHPLTVQNVFREDEAGTSLPVDMALQNAPDRQDSFFAVPAVFD